MSRVIGGPMFRLPLIRNIILDNAGAYPRIPARFKALSTGPATTPQFLVLLADGTYK